MSSDSDTHHGWPPERYRALAPLERQGSRGGRRGRRRRPADPGELPRPEPYEASPELRRAMEQPVGDDRSAQVYGFVARCLETGLTDGQVHQALLDFAPAVEKDSEAPGWIERDLLGSLAKLRPEHDHAGFSCAESVCTAAPALSSELDRGSWEPVDLADVLAGSLTPEEAEVLERSDGVGLLYKGKLNLVFGAPSSMKTWLCVLATAQDLRAGQSVVWIDMEDSPVTLLRRLRSLGVRNAKITEGLSYIRPGAALDRGAADGLVRLCSTRQVHLVVVDSTTELIAINGLQADAGTEVATLHRQLHRLADAGPAVVLIDHVTKSGPDRSASPIGSERKVSGIDGAAYHVELVQDFGVGRTGIAHIKRVKDRPGALSPHLNASNIIAALSMTSDKENGLITAELEPPDVHTGNQLLQAMESISRILETHSEGLNKGRMDKELAEMPYDECTCRTAVARLEAAGFISIAQVKATGNPKIHKSCRPYRVGDRLAVTSPMAEA